MKVGFVGWRGMVGSVLMHRMREENDFEGLSASYFSTSGVGTPGPDGKPLLDATNIAALAENETVISCQGGDYTTSVYSALRGGGWTGNWIDAASTLRMDSGSVIILDPVNREVIDRAVASGVRAFIGGNCTVSLMLMALNGLFQRDLVEWVSTMTYQAASGAGAQAMDELLAQTRHLAPGCEPGKPVESERVLREAAAKPEFPADVFGAPLQFSVLPFIDKEMESGQSREEWKGQVETNKILGREGDRIVPVDGVCVRVPNLRCHSQGLTVKLREKITPESVESLLRDSHRWISVVPNTKGDSIRSLTPSAVSGGLSVAIGRIRTMTIDPTMMAAFTVGDQLLWGAAEPLRRMLGILRGRL